uniref:Uncharacterized protein n=1 Tax=Rhizophora mucronata TaxID=61149 RepID=A0A2P2N8B2_RHIMU
MNALQYMYISSLLMVG